MKKIIKVADFVFTLTITLIAIISLSSIYNYNKTGLSGFCGYYMIQVASPSMTASDILVGDVQLIHHSNTYEVGDIIAYKYESMYESMIIYHEIVEIDQDGNYITKGSSNTIADPKPVSSTQVIGKQVTKMKFNILFSLPVRLSLIGIIYLIMMVSYIIDIKEDIVDTIKSRIKF